MAPKISGYVFDEKRRPVAKAKVSLKGKIVAEAGKDGFFSVDLAKAQSRVALTFTAEGYVPNTKVYNSKAAATYVVVLWPIGYRVDFDAGRGLDIALGSSRIQIPANALAGPKGEKFNGTATLLFTLFDVTSALQRAAAPGDFSGRLLDRSIRRLNSYGIFDLNLQNAKGQPLQLSGGAKIQLAIAIPPKLVGRAPKHVGFYDFDAVTGYWVQVGDFALAQEALTYNGSVTSFGGSHNLDDPQDTTCVTVRVVNDWDSTPLPNFSVTAMGPQYDSYGTTDSNGLVCLLVQRNASFSAKATGSFGGSGYSTPDPLPTFTSPDFSSGADACGDSTMCPVVGTIYASLVVGMIHLPLAVAGA